MLKPASISANVHEKRLGNWRSIQMPSAIPDKVGTTTDQPTKPTKPKPLLKIYN